MIIVLTVIVNEAFPLPSGRELERERGKLERQEKKIITDIKKTAKTGQMVSGPHLYLRH